ncbi:MAG: Ig-like domain-containing protein [Planctomycetota bacterium]
MMNPARRTLVLALAALVLGGGACDTEPDGALRVTSRSPASGALARNEAIILRFDRELDAESAVGPLVKVRGPEGRAIAVTAGISGHSLVLRPRDRAEWPLPGPLELEIRVGLALSFRAADGARLAEDYRASFPLDARWVDEGAPLVLEEIVRPANPGLGPADALRLRFSLPLDPATLPGALVVRAEDGAESEPVWSLADEGRVLEVRPFPRPHETPAGRRHELVLGEGLRSLTGRGLGGAAERIPVWSSPATADEGVLDLDFTASALPTDENPDLAGLEDGARPRLGGLRAVTLNSDQAFDGPDREWIAAPFSRRPGRLQSLIPGASLGSEAVLITGFSFFVREVPDVPLTYPRLLVTIGLPEGELVANPDANLARLEGRQVTVAQGSESGEWNPRPERLGESPSGARHAWVEIRLDRPFPYPGGERDLLVELDNRLGAFPREIEDALPEAWTGMLCAGGPAPGRPRPGTGNGGGPPSTAVVAGPEGAPEARNLVFATKIRFERYLEYVSAWRDAGREAQRFFRIPGTRELDADGVDGADFRFAFQGRRRDGTTTPWADLAELDGCRNIRARLTFLPGSERAAAGRVEVRRLRIRYEGRP